MTNNKVCHIISITEYKFVIIKEIKMSKRTKIELIITALIFVIELIICLVVREDIITSGQTANIDQEMTALLAVMGVLNIFYGIVLIIINSDRKENSETDKQEIIEDQSVENNSDKPE